MTLHNYAAMKSDTKGMLPVMVLVRDEMQNDPRIPAGQTIPALIISDGECIPQLVIGDGIVLGKVGWRLAHDAATSRVPIVIDL